MVQAMEEIEIATRGRGLLEITGEVEAWLASTGLQAGLLTLFCRHTSASLTIQENADPEVQRDLERFLARLVPDGDPVFEHTFEGPDDMPAHVRTLLTQTHLAIPVSAGRMMLGRWQGVYLYEHRLRGHRRRVVLHAMGSGGKAASS